MNYERTDAEKLHRSWARCRRAKAENEAEKMLEKGAKKGQYEQPVFRRVENMDTLREHKGVHCRPLLTPFEARALLAVVADGDARILETDEEREAREALRRAKAKIGRVKRGKR